MFIDSQIMVKLIINEKIECNPSKHTELCECEIIDHHWARKFILNWINGKEYPTDILTKALLTLGHLQSIQDKIVHDVASVTGEYQTITYYVGLFAHYNDLRRGFLTRHVTGGL